MLGLALDFGQPVEGHGEQFIGVLFFDPDGAVLKFEINDILNGDL